MLKPVSTQLFRRQHEESPDPAEICVDVPVSEVMSHHLVTVSCEAPIWEVVQLMAQHQIGAMVVMSRTRQVLGLLTERDVVTRAVAQNRDIKTCAVGQIVLTPIVAVTRDTSAYEALKLMTANQIHRLVVFDKETPVGIVTLSDMLQIVPGLMVIHHELFRLQGNRGMRPSKEKDFVLNGNYCEACGKWSDPLVVYEGAILCPACLEERA